MGYESRPVCDKCWTEREGDRTPVRMLQPDEEVCYVWAIYHTAANHERYFDQLLRRQRELITGGE